MKYSSPTNISSQWDYDPFGMLTVGRSWSVGSEYRYGFNSQEQDDEVYGNGNLNTAEFWEYDTRLGRRWNVDPVKKHHESPFCAFANNPIYHIDPSGADSTTYLYGGFDKEGNLLYTSDELQQIADQSKLVDELNGITFTKYQVVTREQLRYNSELKLNPKTDLIYEVNNTWGNPGGTKPSDNNFVFRGNYFVGGWINPEKIGGYLIDAGNVLAHERLTHGYKMIVKGLFSNGNINENLNRMTSNSSISETFTDHISAYPEYMGLERVYYSRGFEDNTFGSGKYTVLRVQETVDIYNVTVIQALFNYSGGVFANVQPSQSISAYNWGGAGVTNQAYTLILQMYFKDVFTFK